jgi:1-acyl-sn-glycerol-3-phosphate acyltransferase
MNTILARIYSGYAGLMFMVSFLLFLPIILVCIWVPGWKKYGRKINRFWSRLYFILIFLPVKIKTEARIEKEKPYIFLANHFSYLDIPMMGFMPGDVLFVGKASLMNIPLFGYYFRNLHITVNRDNLRSRAETMKRVSVALDSGSSVILFPEGGIFTQSPPAMIPFKNGAFRLALEKQIPIIPVTLSFNHLILPDDGRLLLHWRQAKLVLHHAISAQVNDTENTLKEKCFQIIQQQLNHDHKKL